VPKSQLSFSPATPLPRGEVSGHTSATPCAAHARDAPPFCATFSSVHVSPDK
jgi:hypothetical protein